jgi:purine nucleosidase
MAEKIFLDTDIGSDIDDAVCLAYLLAQPQCELIGITTVTGEVVKRAMLASALCQAAGKTIPIFPGCEQPLLVEQQQPLTPQANALSKWPHETSFPMGEAINFMRHTIRENPGEITLLTIGPLTNVGLLFTIDPEIPRLLKKLVLMCGVFNQSSNSSHVLEWNAKGDPHATAIVYRAPVSQHRSIGLDVTMQVRMDASIVREKFKAPLLRPVLDFAEVWFQHAETIVFHDPLAATTIFDDQICTFTRGRVNINLDGKRLQGRTDWDPSAFHQPHEVATEVNPERFFNHYFSIFK